MSPSQSLTTALEAVERVLAADTSDFNELAAIAGAPVEEVFFGADLTGVDLRESEIDSLLPLLTKFEGAVLTETQRTKFRKAARQTKGVVVRRKISDLRIDLVVRFLDWFEQSGFEEGGKHGLFHRHDRYQLKTSKLQELLLVPVDRLSRQPTGLTSEFVNVALRQLSGFSHTENHPFLVRLFKLLGDLVVPFDEYSRAIFDEHYSFVPSFTTGELIAQLRPTYIMDRHWLSLWDEKDFVRAASVLGEQRPIHTNALEDSLDDFDWSTLLEVFSRLPFDCDVDVAERMAARLTRQSWPASQTQLVLRLKTHPKLQQAIFRQLLAQGNGTRVVEVIRWLDDNKGAAGALSLENALSIIKDFDLALRLAKELAPRLAQNQLSAVADALDVKAVTREQVETLKSMRTKFGLR